jgi:phthiodiolone/phenolphthiodiolone dimycocerosates ketoreductase
MPAIRFGAVLPYFPPAEMLGLGAKFLEDAGTDYAISADQLNFVIPRSICTPDIVPSVGAGFDLDMWMDSFLIVGAAAAATERLGMSLICDTRRGPANIAQGILTLDHLSHGRFHFYLGAGEVKQWAPYGVPRDKPFSRQEECLRIVKMLIQNKEPFSYDGPIWKLKNAILRLEPYEPTRPPKLVVLGGPGPSVKIAERGIREGFADGWASLFPTCGSADWYAETLAKLRAAAESADRDPDELIFDCMASTIVYAEECMREQYITNPAMRLHSAAESTAEAWKRWGGGTHPLGEDYSYSRDFIPMDWSREEALRIANMVPPELVTRAKFTGTPEQVAEQMAPYLQAGSTHCVFGNFVTMLSSGDFSDALEKQNLTNQTIEHLRKLTASV